MTIQEASKSGRAFRRRGLTAPDFFVSLRDDEEGIAVVKANGAYMMLELSDILADDWELESKKKELSAEDILKHVDTIYNRFLGKPADRVTFHAMFKDLVKELELE